MTLTPAQKCESETNCEWMVDWFLTDTDERTQVIAVLDHATWAPIFARPVGAAADIHRGC